MSSPRCPICQASPPEDHWRPFCSERCKLVDLGRWLGGVYAIPGEPVDPRAHGHDAEEERG